MKMIGAAAEILPPGSDRTPEWYDARRAGITASEIAAVLGLSRWQSPLSLYYQKTGDAGEDYDNDRLALGRALEPYVLERFSRDTGVPLSGCGLIASAMRPWQLATPDAICLPASGGSVPCPVEAKTALNDDDWGRSGSDQVPVHYRCQVMWQCDVLGAPYGYLCVVFLRTGQPRWYKIPADDGDCAAMRDAALDFLARVEERRPPAVDGSEATHQALRRYYKPSGEAPDAVCGRGLRRQYAAAVKARRAAEDRHRLAANKVREAMGQSLRLAGPDGVIIATRRGPKDALYPARGLTG